MWDFAKWACPHSPREQSRAGCQALQVTRSSPWPGVKIPQSRQIDCVPTTYIYEEQPPFLHFGNRWQPLKTTFKRYLLNTQRNLETPVSESYREVWRCRSRHWIVFHYSAKTTKKICVPLYIIYLVAFLFKCLVEVVLTFLILLLLLILYIYIINYHFCKYLFPLI